LKELTQGFLASRMCLHPDVDPLSLANTVLVMNIFVAASKKATVPYVNEYVDEF